MTLLRLFIESSGRLLGLVLASFMPGPSGWGAWARRVPIMAVFLPVFALAQLIHWIGFLLDEILFPGYRDVPIESPLFVLGVPRSGTTHLHRVLAQDTRFTTFSTWECLFALSVSERRFWMALARLDRALGRPLGRPIAWVEARAFGGLASVHSMGLGAPEEDYFALMPVLACFILVLPFPADPYLWRMAGFDREMPEPERLRLLEFYRGCLKRHLYAQGQGKRLLSKNAAFAPLAGGLRAAFPDARFLVCLREPTATFPSQLSSLESGLALFGSEDLEPGFRDRLAGRLAFYYRNLEVALGDLGPGRCAWLTMADLKSDLQGSVESAYGRLGIPMDADFAARLAESATESKGYQSGHSYSLEGLAPHTQALIRDLESLYARLAARSALSGIQDSDQEPAPHGAQKTPQGAGHPLRSDQAALPC